MNGEDALKKWRKQRALPQAGSNAAAKECVHRSASAPNKRRFACVKGIKGSKCGKFTVNTGGTVFCMAGCPERNVFTLFSGIFDI